MGENALAIFDLDGTITRRDTLLPYIWGYLRRHPQRWWRLPLCLAPLGPYLLGRMDRGALKGAVIRWRWARPRETSWRRGAVNSQRACCAPGSMPRP